MVSKALTGQPVRMAVRQVAAELQAGGCPDPDADARMLVSAVTGCDPRVSDAPVNALQASLLATWTNRRAAREPLQYLLGRWGFLDFTLAVGPGVLCPRADTEVVCEAAVRRLQSVAAPDVLDLCAGSGCLGLGIKRLVPTAQVTALEKSETAYRYLRTNAATALPGFSPVQPAVRAVRGDVRTYAGCLAPHSLDLIVANPPYLTAQEMAALQPEVAREPSMALDGGPDGLAFYRMIAQDYRESLRVGGWLVLEIGWQQRQSVEEILRQNGWQNLFCEKDYAGNDRVVGGQP